MDGYLVLLNVDDGQVPAQAVCVQGRSLRTGQDHPGRQPPRRLAQGDGLEVVLLFRQRTLLNWVVEFRDGVPTNLWFFEREGDEGEFALQPRVGRESA